VFGVLSGTKNKFLSFWQIKGKNGDKAESY
jgi:hypothetical protein